MISNRKKRKDEFLKKIIDEFEMNSRPGFSVENKVLKFQNRLCVPNISNLKKRILDEAHKSMFTMHPCNNKMYQDLKQSYLWPNMKPEIAEYVSKCL